MFLAFDKDTTGLSKVVTRELNVLNGFSKDLLSKKKDSLVKIIYTATNWKVRFYLANSYSFYFRNRDLKPEATELFDQAIDAIKNQWYDKALDYVIGVSNIYSKDGMSGYAFQVLTDALNFSEGKNDLYSALRIHIQLLNFYHSHGEFKMAIQEWKLIDSVILSTGKNEEKFKTLRATSWNTVGLIETEQKNYRSALAKFDTVKKLARESANDFLEALAGGNQGNFFFRLKEYEKAREMLIADIAVSKENNDFGSASISAIRLAEVYIAQKKPILASKYIDSVKIWYNPELCKRSPLYQKLLAHYSVAQSDYKNAYLALERVLAIRDSIGLPQDKVDLVKSISKVDLMNKQRIIELLKTENAYINNRVAIVNALIIAITLALIASVIASVLYIRNYNTKRKIEQDKLAEEFRVKAEIASAKEEILSILSHEIRTPLNSVIGLTHVLSRRDPRADQEEIIHTLEASADHLMHIVNDILDFNKIQAKGISLELLPFDLRTVLNQIHSMFIRIAEDRNLALSVQVDSSIPNALMGDATRLIQVLSNLVSNGLKFTLAGSVNLNAKLISLDGMIANIEFVVRDTGLGIAQHEIENIFLPFQQEKNVHGKFGGTGLGLTIVKNLVELMGGNVAVTSTHGEGSTFTMCIPFRVQQENIEAAADQQLNPTPQGSLKEKKILYVEDVESNWFLVKSILEDYSMTCENVEDGTKARAIVCDNKYDLILLDIQLPDMDGFEVARAIRTDSGSLNKTTPIILFSALTNFDGEDLKACGANDLLGKPFQQEILIRKIAALIGQTQSAS